MSEFARLDRRAFLGRITITVGGAAAAAVLPVSLLQAAATSRFPSCVVHDPCGDWELDDMCNAYPTYSMHLDTGGVVRNKGMSASIEPVDRYWVG
jgi:hypothetical protein